MKKSIIRFISILILLLLLWQSKLAYEGAVYGLTLWATVVLPTLLPFMICSNAIVALNAIDLLTLPFRWFLQHVLKLSKAGSYVLVSGILCGYPMGAKTCSEFLIDQKITKKEGQYLLSICNHPSPMFLLGFVALRLPGVISMPYFLVAIYLPTLLIAWLARSFYQVTEISPSLDISEQTSLSFDERLMQSFDVMVKIGGYMMIFSILAVYLNTYIPAAPLIKASLLGTIEITTGIQAIANIIPSFKTGLCIIFVAAFGGLSGIFQTKSVLLHSDLSIKHYAVWKLLHALLAVTLMIIFLNLQSYFH